MRVLDIDVPGSLVARWRDWLMPGRQPYRIPAGLARERGWSDARERLEFELRDSFELYRIGDDEAVVWLDRRSAFTLPPDVRRGQPAIHRWPTSDRERDLARTVRFVEQGRRVSRHSEIRDWTTISTLLPGAEALAGTFAERSGPNCFGTVMAAAGVPGAAREWMQLQPFEDWLTARTEPGGNDDQLGTVLVWRTADGRPAHAAVTLGAGWLLHKPSQGWMSPRKVLSVPDGKFSSRAAGRRLTRRRLVAR